ncbi:DUF6770 family protein [Ekhidna sp.]|uniref:DUF6770 family protein n=1 Tax=Ekhidna sp. TaxID=2608089 RepID=UPI003C7E88A9
MKNSLNLLRFNFFAATFLASLICFSQSTTLQGVTKGGFKGINKLDDNGYYVRFVESAGQGKKAGPQVHLYILDNNLSVTNDFVVPLGKGESIEDMAYNNGKFMFIAGSKDYRTRQFTIVDQEGNEVASKKLEKVNRRLLEKPASISAVGEGDFIVINYIKEKKVGYSVSRFDGNLNEKFSTEQIPDKKKLYPVDYHVDENQVFVLEFITPDLSDYFEYHIAGYDVNTGTENFKVQLKDPASDASGYATFIKPGKDGSIVTGGMYFNGNRTKSANSDGFFAAIIDKNGTPGFSFTDWKEVKDDLADGSTEALWGGKTKTLMQDVTINDDGSFTLIGENYRRGDAALAGKKSKSALAIAGKASSIMGGGSGEKEIAVTVSDIALMDFDASGAFKGIRKLDEATSITIIKDTDDKEDQPYVGQRKGLNLANILNNNGYFPYRFTTEKSGEKYIVSVVKYEPQAKELLYFTRLNSTSLDTASVEFTNTELKVIQELQNQMMGKLGGLGKLTKKASKATGSDVENEFLLRGSHDPFDYRSKSGNIRVIKSNKDGEVIIYDFIPEDTGDKKGFMAQYGAALKGNLSIQSIKIPN